MIFQLLAGAAHDAEKTPWESASSQFKGVLIEVPAFLQSEGIDFFVGNIEFLNIPKQRVALGDDLPEFFRRQGSCLFRVAAKSGKLIFPWFRAARDRRSQEYAEDYDQGGKISLFHHIT
jgi:hypothetical protein